MKTSVTRYNIITVGLLKKEERRQRRRMPNCYFLLRMCVGKFACAYDIIHLFDWKSAVENDGGV